MSEENTVGPTPRKMSQETKDINDLIFKMPATTSPVRLELLNDEVKRLLGKEEKNAA